MASKEVEHSMLLPHHKQQDLCTTRLPYRQGRKLTAVKIYTVNNESKHLLIFGVPSLNIRRETKEMFLKFGKLSQFNLTKYPSEEFTETYHAVYESIQSARLAKKMLDTKNYYGGSLHISYAPELENIEETKEKLLLRRTQVLGRLKNLHKEEDASVNTTNMKIDTPILNDNENVQKMFMGSNNTIQFGGKVKNRKRKYEKMKVKQIDFEIDNENNINTSKKKSDMTQEKLPDMAESSKTDGNIEVIDFTSVQTEVISNINEALNYKNFGQEIIRTVPYKPVNKIKFNINKKS